jgi:hypothetical protein
MVREGRVCLQVQADPADLRDPAAGAVETGGGGRVRALMVLALLALTSARASAQPAITSWDFNTDGHTGYGGIPADVQALYLSSGYVYVECTGIPSYSIGPWAGDPNTPANQSWRFKITRSPMAATNHTATPLGQIGVWKNGVVAFNALDANSYQNRNVWHQNAVVVEASSFDACLGHPAPGGVYHHHQNPRCLDSAADTTVLSPLLGYAFDGFPIYGPYSCENVDGSGGVRRMRSSYRTRAITTRTALPDGTVLTAANYGPSVSGAYPLGYYVEDFEYVAGLGDLDEYNGRMCVTPEYPQGAYAYFATIDASVASAYPYVVGPHYYGVVVAGNTGPGRGHVTIGEPVTRYDPTLSVPKDPATGALLIGPVLPNPARGAAAAAAARD